MADIALKLQIDNLKVLIALEVENYKTAMQTQTDVVILQKLRKHIKNLNSELQDLLDQA